MAFSPVFYIGITTFEIAGIIFAPPFLGRFFSQGLALRPPAGPLFLALRGVWLEISTTKLTAMLVMLSVVNRCFGLHSNHYLIKYHGHVENDLIESTESNTILFSWE